MRIIRFCRIFNSQLDYCVAELLEIVGVKGLVLGQSGKLLFLYVKLFIVVDDLEDGLAHVLLETGVRDHGFTELTPGFLSGMEFNVDGRVDACKVSLHGLCPADGEIAVVCQISFR